MSTQQVFSAANCPRVEFLMTRPAYEALVAKLRQMSHRCVYCGHEIGLINDEIRHREFLAQDWMPTA